MIVIDGTEHMAKAPAAQVVAHLKILDGNASYQSRIRQYLMRLRIARDFQKLVSV